MTIKIVKGIIFKVIDGEEYPIGALMEIATEMDEKIIECGSDIIPAVQNFIAEVNSGSFKPRKLVKELEQILYKHAI